MRRHGFPTVDALQRRSVEDLEWYWNEVSRDLGWHWSTPYEKVADLSRGIQWPQWFPGGRMNLTENCIDKHLPRRRSEPAIISEAENGETRTLTYAELADEVGRLANALKRLVPRATPSACSCR
jgi:acetyl-CoA synthetase